MRLIYFTSISAFAFSACVCAAKEAKSELTLAEKIAMAKQIAEEASDGKVKAGMVVDTSLNMAEITRRYREKSDAKTLAQTQALNSAMQSAQEEAEIQAREILEEKRERLKARAAAQEAEKAKSETVVQTEKIAAEKSVEKSVEKKSEKVSEARVDKIEKKELASGFEEKSKSVGNSGKPAKTDDLRAIAKEENVKVEKIEAVADEKVVPAKKEKLSPVDTSKNFVNGFYVGDENDSNGLDLAKQKRVFSYIDTAFKAFSYDTFSLNQSSDVIRACRETFEQFFGIEGKLVLARPVELQIITEENSQMKTSVGADIRSNGEILLAVKWDENLKLDAFCSLLSGGLLRAIAFNCGGFESQKKLPHWLELALEAATEQKIRFGVLRDMARKADELPPSSVSEIFNFTRENVADSNLARVHAYWNLVALREMLGSKTSEFFRVYLSKPQDAASSMKVLSDFIGLSEDSLNERWRCVVTGEIRSKLAGIRTFDDSRDELVRLAAFAIDDGQGGIKPIAGREIFDNRGNRDLLDELSKRVVEIKFILSRVNPAYYNAYVSLGRNFESVLEDDEDLFNSTLADFAHELKRSDEIADKATQLMRESKKN